VKIEPGVRELLDATRSALVNDVVPLLPADRRYAALMAANALAIAMREMDAPDTAARELARVDALLGEAGRPLAETNRVLAARIRTGAFDEGEARRHLLDHLQATTRERLAISNPKAIRPAPEKP
jgi:hypothetical protein